MATIPERIVMNENVKQMPSSLLFPLATSPMLKNTVSPVPAIHKQFQ